MGVVEEGELGRIEATHLEPELSPSRYLVSSIYVDKVR